MGDGVVNFWGQGGPGAAARWDTNDGERERERERERAQTYDPPDVAF